MKPINFPTQNVVFGKDQRGVEPLPAHEENGIVTTIWEVSDREILSIIDSKKIILEIYVGDNRLQPVNLLTIQENEERKQ